MKRVMVIFLAAALVLSPAQAQDTDVDEGFDLLEEGARLLMRGLLAEIEPSLDELQDQIADIGPMIGVFVEQMGPAFTELLAQLDDLRHYENPEILPNGDIIIRRRQNAPAWIPQTGDGEIEL